MLSAFTIAVLIVEMIEINDTDKGDISRGTLSLIHWSVDTRLPRKGERHLRPCI
jgi:hypothetical protein